MIPGISTATEQCLLRLLEPAITDLSDASLQSRAFTLLPGASEEALALGIRATGGGELMVVVTDPVRPVGQVAIEVGGRNNLLFFDNQAWGGNLQATIRIVGSDTTLFFNDIADAFVSLPQVFLRSDGQLLFWGAGASAVGCMMELEGEGASVAIGDDALISAGVWIRNYDMHAVHDLRSGRRINQGPVDTVLERHVWLGQDAMLLATRRIGMGSIIGARALVKGEVPAMVAMAGTPARIIREGVSWGRDTYAMTERERLSLGLDRRAPGRI